MAAATMPAIATKPADLDEHIKDQARRKKEDDRARARLMDCLDPSVAKRYEDAKPMWTWNVQASLFQPATAKSPAHMKKVERQVVAQDEQEAWARYCDDIGEWPSPRDSQVKFSKLERSSLRAPEQEE